MLMQKRILEKNARTGLLTALCTMPVFAATLLAACTKELDLSPQTPASSAQTKGALDPAHVAKEIHEYTLQDMQAFHEAGQKWVFSQMTASDKARIWGERVDQAISATTDQAKISALTNLKALITASTYAVADQAPGAIGQWVTDNKPLFGYSAMRALVNGLGGVGSTNPVGWTPVGSGCTCSAKSDWCVSDYNDKMTCKTGACDQTNGGCGTLWIFDCRGICVSDFLL